MPSPDNFDATWGVGDMPAPQASAPSPTRSLDPKAFDNAWLTDSAPTSTATPATNTSGVNAGANAFLGSTIDSIPIIGPFLKDYTERAGAGARSLIYGTPYKDELDFVRRVTTENVKAHPVASTAGEVTGAVAPMLMGAGAAPGVFGMTGPLWQRAVAGGATNALINAGDTAVRGGDLGQTLTSAAVGGGIGGGFPLAGKVAGATGRALFSGADRGTNALAQRAEAHGIPIYFSQTATPFIQKVSQMAGKLPGSGIGTLIDTQQRAFNRAVARTFGEDAEKITPDVMAAAKKRIGSEFDHVANNTKIQVDTPLITDMHRIVSDAESAVAGSELTIVNKQISNVIDKIMGSGEIDGKAYQALTKKGSPLDRAIHHSDSNVSYYAGQVKEALNDALERSAPKDLAERLRTARGQYKAMKTIEDLSEKSPTGDINPALLMNPVRQSYGNMAYGGGGDLADLARIGQRFMRLPPDSGTPLGHAALNLLMHPATMLAAGGAGGYLYGNDAQDVLKGAALLPLTALTARGATTLLNRPEAVNALIRKTPATLPLINQLVNGRESRADAR